MREYVEYLQKRGLIFCSLEPFELLQIGSKKRFDVFVGVDTNGYYILLVVVKRKSRFLVKDADGVEEISQKIAAYLGHNFKKKILLIKAPLCSKAKDSLKSWKIYALS